MPEGPVVALAVLVVGLAVLGIAFAVARLRQPRARHHASRTAPRLPLFGTDLLVVRTADDELIAADVPAEGEGAEGGEGADDGAGAARPTPSMRPAAARTDGDRRSGDGPSPFAPPAAPAATGAPLAGGAGAAPNGAPARPRATPPRPAPARPLVERPGAPRAPIEIHTTHDATARPAAAAPAFAGAAALAPREGGLSTAAAAPAIEIRPGGGTSPAPALRPDSGEYVDGQTLRFAVPTDGTLQFLPGRLEVIAGPDAGREIRFVRLPGRAAVNVTFGRNAGEPYSHVQLHARTVSRQHAVMTLLDDHWQLQNLSTTNPVVLNGRSLAPDEVAPLLVDGDRIEMGEIVFVFRGR